ncbi:MAG: plasmid pRiA4b ORF-3 family protein [Bacilli bacterium]
MNQKTSLSDEIAGLPLLANMDAYLDYLATHRVALTKRAQWLSRKNLRAINEMLPFPEPGLTEHKDQDAYPLLHLLYHVTVSGRLFRRGSDAGTVTLQATERYAVYGAMNPVEKYVALLEILWVNCDWHALQGGSSNRAPTGYAINAACSDLSRLQPGMKQTISPEGEEKLPWEFTLRELEYFLDYFAWFGFWVYTRRPNTSKLLTRHFSAETITIQPLCTQMAPILVRQRSLDIWNAHEFAVDYPEDDADGESGETRDEPFRTAFLGLFPEGVLRQGLPTLASAPTAATYTCKVSLDRGCWRRVELAASHTLTDLHDIVQTAFGFGNDHLYSFFMDGKRWSRNGYHCPYASDGPYTDDAILGELELFVGQRFMYLFDYGDEWTFTVEVTGIDPQRPAPGRPKVTEEKGEAPDQHGWS